MTQQEQIKILNEQIRNLTSHIAELKARRKKLQATLNKVLDGDKNANKGG